MAFLRVNLILSFVIMLASLAQVSAEQTTRAKFDLLHLWTVDIEKDALAVLSRPMIARGVNWTEQAVNSNFVGVKSEFAERYGVGNPPEGSFWIGGTQPERLLKDNFLRPINKELVHSQFSSLVRPEIIRLIESENGYTALPLVIHIQSLATYNRDILNKLEIDIPDSWSEVLNISPKLKEAGYYTLSLSDQALATPVFY